MWPWAATTSPHLQCLAQYRSSLTTVVCCSHEVTSRCFIWGEQAFVFVCPGKGKHGKDWFFANGCRGSCSFPQPLWVCSRAKRCGRLSREADLTRPEGREWKGGACDTWRPVCGDVFLPTRPHLLTVHSVMSSSVDRCGQHPHDPFISQ